MKTPMGKARGKANIFVTKPQSVKVKLFFMTCLFNSPNNRIWFLSFLVIEEDIFQTGMMEIPVSRET